MRSARSSTQTGIERAKGVLIPHRSIRPRGVARVEADGLAAYRLLAFRTTRGTSCTRDSFRDGLTRGAEAIPTEVRMNLGHLNCWVGRRKGLRTDHTATSAKSPPAKLPECGVSWLMRTTSDSHRA